MGLNIAQFNQFLFNGWARAGAVWITDDIIFNGFGLQNQNFVTNTINFRNMPKINLLTYDNPKNDGGWVLDRFYKQRTITLEWTILWSDADNMEQRIDTLKKILSAKTWYLQVKVAGVYRRILCSLTNSDIITRKHYDITRWTYKLTFTALDPFRSEKVRSSKTFSWITQNINEDVINEWSEYSNPIINILVLSASSVTTLKNKIWNNEIIVSTSLNVGDVFEINSIEKTVTLNWNSIDFSWRFPQFESWQNIYSMTCDWTFNFDIAILFPKNYL